MVLDPSSSIGQDSQGPSMSGEGSSQQVLPAPLGCQVALSGQPSDFGSPGFPAGYKDLEDGEG